MTEEKKKHARRKLTQERADSINRKRDTIEGTDRSIETPKERIVIGPDGRGAMTDAAVIGIGIHHQLKPGGPEGIVGSTPTGGTNEHHREGLLMGATSKKLVVHCKKEPFDVYVGRPSAWGNPFSDRPRSVAEVKVDSREEAIACFREWVLGQPEMVERILRDLRGRVLGCWCSPQACHADVLAEIANS